MKNNQLANIASPFSTGGGGYSFENEVQSAFVLTMLVDGELPCLCDSKINEIIFQAKHKGYNTDDLVVLANDKFTKRNKKLLIQIKHSIDFTSTSTVLEDVIASAWSDFNNHTLFNIDNDSILLITGPLSKNDINNTRMIFDVARGCSNSVSFFNKINTAKLYSQTLREKLSVLIKVLTKVNKGKKTSDDDIFSFFKIFYISGFDVDLQESVTKSLIHTIAASRLNIEPIDVWNRIISLSSYFDRIAGELEHDSKNQKYQDLKYFLRNEQKIPQSLKNEDFNVKVDSDLIRHPVQITKLALLGSWRETSTKDKAVVEKFLSVSPDEVLNIIVAIDSFLQIIQKKIIAGM